MPRHPLPPAPRDCHILILQTCEYVTWKGSLCAWHEDEEKNLDKYSFAIFSNEKILKMNLIET